MGRYYTQYEVAKILRVDPEIVSVLPIHKCPRGYSQVEIDHFIAEHHLPVRDDIYETIAVSSRTSPSNEEEDKRRFIKWVDSWQEALFLCSEHTRVIIFGENVPRDVCFSCYPMMKIRSPPLFLITVRGPQNFCHVRAETWKEAMIYARGFTG